MQQRNLSTQVPIDLKPLIGGFLSRRMQDIASLEALAREGDFEAIAAIAHKLKGNGLGYGFPAISEVGAEMQLAAHLKEKAHVEALIGEFKELIHHFQRQYLV
jgi:HPt (histidine-containing phosphotransfer) domain-containing protein